LGKALSIIHVLDKNRFDTGSVHQMFQAAAGLRELGHNVAIVSRDDSTMAGRCREAAIRFVPAPFASDLDVRTIAVIRKIVRELRADVIHVHKGRPHTLALAATWRHPAGAFIVNRGVSFPLTVWNRGKYRTDRVDRVVTVCEQIRQIVIRSGKLPPEKVEVVYAGTDTGLFDPERWSGQEFRDEKSIPRERFLLMQVGVRDWKGWRELIEALAALRDPAVHLALVACRDFDEVRAYAAAHGVADAVTAVEPRDDIPRVLAAADAVVDASWAGTGITGTIREGMAMARPVIATDCGGNAELVSSPDLGWLVPSRDVPALAAAIREVKGSPERAAVIGANGRRHVDRHFSKGVRIKALDELYRRILAQKN
jgi:glycosyltransferase involved in cell wall biosynthesis